MRRVSSGVSRGVVRLSRQGSIGSVWRVVLAGLGRARDGRQAQHAAGGGGFGGVAAVAVPRALFLRLLHHGVDGADDGRGVAPGVVAGQQVAAQAVANEGLCRAEHLRLGAAEAVDALLGVAHDEHARRLTRAGVARQPGVQRLPLQRVGVLEFVDQQVFDARVQPLLHPTAEHRVGQQHLRGAFDVVHVHPAARALDHPVFGEQAAREAGHALLMEPGGVLGLGGQHVLHRILRGAHGVDVGERVVELARLVRQREQRDLDTGPTPGRDGLLQLDAFSRVGFLARPRQRLRGRQQQGPPDGLRRKRLAGLLEAGELGKDVATRWHGGLHYAGLVGQHELGAPAQGRGQGFLRLRAAVFSGNSRVVGAQRGIGSDGGLERAPEGGHSLVVTFQQLVVAGQAQLLQHGQRRGAQERGKPAVEGADLHRAVGGEHGAVQIL